MSQFDYELALFQEAAKRENTEKWNAIHALRFMGENKDRWHLLEKSSFRWTLNGCAISHAYEGCDIEYVCKENDFRIYQKINDSIYLVERKEPEQKLKETK